MGSQPPNTQESSKRLIYSVSYRAQKVVPTVKKSESSILPFRRYRSHKFGWDLTSLTEPWNLPYLVTHIFFTSLDQK